MKRFSEKTQRRIQAIATAKMELFVALVCCFQPLTNFTKNPNTGAMGVLNAPLECYNILKFLHVIKLSIAELYPTFLEIIYFAG